MTIFLKTNRKDKKVLKNAFFILIKNNAIKIN